MKSIELKQLSLPDLNAIATRLRERVHGAWNFNVECKLMEKLDKVNEEIDNRIEQIIL